MTATINHTKNTFEEVVIGTQTWMKRNYDFGGDYPDDDEANLTDYGRLYTWDEAMAISVPGWHLPTITEWNTLSTYLGGSFVAGGLMKETGTTYWDSPNEGANNSSGFSGRAAGISGGNFKLYQFFWSATEYDTSNAYLPYLSYVNTSFVTTNSNLKTYKASVRLIKD